MNKEEITRLLSDTKIDIRGHEEEVQKKLFSLGIYWNHGHDVIGYVGFIIIEVLRDGILYISNCMTTLEEFKSCPRKKITAKEILDIIVGEENFKDGDILFLKTKDNIYIFIKRIFYCSNKTTNYVNVKLKDGSITLDGEICNDDEIEFIRKATNDEKQVLLNAINEKGYNWNTEKKLVKKIHEFEPFEKVLVRMDDYNFWRKNFFDYFNKYNPNYPFVCITGSFAQCIHYKGNELLDRTKNKPK